MKTDEIAWLVEGQASGRPVWWTGEWYPRFAPIVYGPLHASYANPRTKDDFEPKFSPEHSEAIRFARKADAERAVKLLPAFYATAVRVVEHMWCDVTPGAAGEAGAVDLELYDLLLIANGKIGDKLSVTEIGVIHDTVRAGASGGPDLPRVDKDGCYTLPDGTCAGCPHCPHRAGGGQEQPKLSQFPARLAELRRCTSLEGADLDDLWAAIDTLASPAGEERPSGPSVEHFNAALREMRAKFDGSENPPLAPHDLHRWVSWLTEVEWFLSRVAAGTEGTE